MSDRIENLYAVIAARPANALAGWRAGQAVDNAQLLVRVGAWQELLRAQPGRHFALYLEDSIEFGAALLGAWHAGKTIWLSADTLPASCAVLRGEVDGFLGEFPAELAPLLPAAVAAAAAGSAAFPALEPDLPALVVFTSGSTGAAQAIPKKLSQIASEVATLEELFGARAGDAAVLATVSHQHIYGLLFKVLWPLASGRAIHAASIVYPEELLPAMAAGPCLLVASPAHLKRLPSHLDWSAAAAMLRGVFSSGGPLAADAALATGALLGQVPTEVYGSSETGGIAWRQRRDIGDDAWRPFPNVSWRINEADGTLDVCSPHLADDNWLALADRAAAVDGGFRLLGRSDRIVKIEEKRVSLDAMEAALLASGHAIEARVALCEPVPGERQRLAAFVVPSPEGRALLEQQGKQALNARLRAVLAGVVDAVALPRRWRYLDQMPVNAQGKVTLAALLSLLGDERPRLPLVRELERDAGRVLLEITAPARLLYFDGHFDVAPILPGVVQVDWAMHYGREYFDLPPQFKGMSQLKFQQVVGPETPVQLELAYDAAKRNLRFSYGSAVGQHSSGRIALGGVDG
ncbi:Acyl-coenzyme A synthetase/AMP-(fatty) acid ligase [Duganella sp. CF458]|uniref:AMP-binding protein n=1 Tax=Duganella sp. CF458 TaxID=1884368 RepID=UPI0008E3F7AA|nr:AMP-binding protein [Duganella sp. CF458]SFG10506.1 Acyl-coenzyme A synthetase/AMP-(fatty) acid ligase [Duganella sp. CF458]